MKVKRKLKYILAPVYMFILMGMNVFASEPTFVSGTRKLISDLTLYLVGLVAAVTTICLIWTGYQWNMASDEEKPKYNKKAKHTLFVGVGIMIASGVVSWVFGYYGG